MSYVNSFKELTVYQSSRALAKAIFALSKNFPKVEDYSLTDQIRRSSRSVGAQIAEAWAKRKYPRHFMSKLTDADGETAETQHWIEIAYDCQYFSDTEKALLLEKCIGIGKMLNSMISKVKSFYSQ
ncbi:MAG TPA: four helix bundle protein [Cyclobacteriaceae bacterium]|nr:four helix bundle protein [Cyclobacteriaceae bacterium]